LAGDRSLTNVVAHEITHSWSGNYVSNANWKDFWLNEGFTVYIERLILGEVNSAAYRDFEILGGYNDLVKTVSDTMGEHPNWTRLQPDLEGIDPDDAFSKIPYEKGSLFLLYLEQIVGGVKKMQEWLKSYFTTFRTQSLTTEQMREHFLSHFKNEKRLKEIDWESWLKGEGMPKFNPSTVCDRSMVICCESLAKKWLEEDGKGALSSDLDKFLSKQKMYFLDLLITSGKLLKPETLERLDSVYSFSRSQNVEVGFRYLMLSLRNKHRAVFPAVSLFLSRHGRGLYTKPLYKELHKLDKEEASKVYHTHKAFYHSVIRNFCKNLGL
jgi:leukotriene-A4 hydrolase